MVPVNLITCTKEFPPNSAWGSAMGTQAGGLLNSTSLSAVGKEKKQHQTQKIDCSIKASFSFFMQLGYLLLFAFILDASSPNCLPQASEKQN